MTIADYVADLRAPTPSAAAELAVFDYRQFESARLSYQAALNQAMERKKELGPLPGRAVPSASEAA